MFITVSACALLLTLSPATPLPDAIDHLRSEPVKPQIDLVMDSSGSMGLHSVNNGVSCLRSECSWYYDTYASGTRKQWKESSEVNGPLCKRSSGGVDVFELLKYEQVQASLVGCKNANDGILDRWDGKADFILHKFSSSASLVAGRGATKAELETAVLGVGATGNTNQTDALYDAGKYMKTTYDNTNASTCTPFYIVMLSDGDPTAGGQNFDYECTAPVESKPVGREEPWWGSDYLQRHPDIMCSVSGNQNVRTYTIGFGAAGSFYPQNLQNIADYGGGDYYYASDASELDAVFSAIISEIVDSSAVFFSPPAVQTEAFFASNFAYSASFRPRKNGPWAGTLKKFCVVPPQTAAGKYDSTNDDCMFVSPDGEQLSTNPHVKDQWTGVTDLSADEGGSGLVLFDQMDSSQGGEPKTPYWGHRNILTWRDGQIGYVAVNKSSLSSGDTWTNGCDHYRLLNFLHGYTFDANCATGAPVALREWIMGDPINSTPILLRYGACETATGEGIPANCYVVIGMNDGMLHIFDAANGEERSALVPPELWAPNPISNTELSRINDQPGTDYSHRYYVDGGARLFHEDTNRNNEIDSSESAWLLFGLGRGGAAYYALKVSTLAGGIPTTAHNPIFPIGKTENTAFEDLQDTWAAPWAGLAQIEGQTKRVVAFGSGHDWESDGAAWEPPLPPGTQTVDCTGAGGFAAFNGQPDSWCSQYYTPSPTSCTSSPYCYDKGSNSIPQPIDITWSLSFNDGVWIPGSFRVRFSAFDLQSADKVNLRSAQGILVESYIKNNLNESYTWSDWVNGSTFQLQFKTDGKRSNNRGFKIDKIQWVPSEMIGGPPEPPPPPVPAVWIVDLENFNGSPARAFTNAPTEGSVLVQIAKTCAGPSNDGVCLDASKAPDLANMVCPISSEIAVKSDGGVASAFYWGDECGQIWKAWTEDKGVQWKARRLINLNSGSKLVDTDHRKIFRRLDLVHSSCPGRSVIGVYFGTGNVQRPNAKDELMNTAITDGRELVGVIWDYESLPSNLTQANLADATTTPVDAKAIFAQGKVGWYLRLNRNERMLRDPLVFDGVAYFKTYQPNVDATTCGAGSGIDRVYGLKNCTAASVTDGSAVMSEREIWAGQTEVGGGLFLFTPKDSPVLVSHADLSQASQGNLNELKRPRLKLLLWRRVDR